MAPHLPVLGEYFVFKLNPSQTLNLILDDPEVARECEALGARCRKYVGCCIGWTGIPAVGTLFPFEMSMVSRGLVAYPKGFVTEDMSIPILPTVYHPRGRKPLIVDPPLPWDNCYHCTLAMMMARVLYRERDVRPRGKYALMPRQQRCILELQEADDGKWREKLIDMDRTGGTDFEPEPIQDQEGIEAFYEVLKSEPDMCIKSKEPIGGPELEDVDLSLDDDPLMDLDSIGEADVQTSLDSEDADSVSQSSSYDAFREEMARQFDYTPVIDLTLDLEMVPVDELADNMFDFYEELLEMGEILLAHRAKVAAALANVQRQDAEFDAKVAAARQSKLSTEGSDTPSEGSISSVSCLTEKLSPPCTPPIEQKMTISEEDAHQTRSQESSNTMAAGDADRCISTPSDHQPDDAPTTAVSAAAATNTRLSTTTLVPSTPAEIQIDEMKPSRHFWRSLTRSMKNAPIQIIKATRKVGSVCYNRCSDMLCC